MGTKTTKTMKTADRLQTLEASQRCEQELAEAVDSLADLFIDYYLADSGNHVEPCRAKHIEATCPSGTDTCPH
jgi:hypothetical protein